MTTAGAIRQTMPGWLTNVDVESFAEGQVFTIVFAGTKPVGQANEEKAVLLFSETPKGLVLNNRTVDALEALFGDEPLEGKRVRIGLVEDRGKSVKTVFAAER